LLTGLHFLLTYDCNFECDHCFLYCAPRAGGTFTLSQIRQVLLDARRIDSIDQIYFEGGEPFLYHPLLLEGVRLATSLGFTAGVVSNAYFATTDEDAELWLYPLAEAGLADCSFSDDAFHFGTAKETPAQCAVRVARHLEMNADTICIEQPAVEAAGIGVQEKGASIIQGGARFRGRAVEKLTEGLPRRPWQDLTECPYEDLAQPGRVHLDAFGNVHLCQGLSMGNLWQTPLSTLLREYDPQRHPICGPLLRGGPARLVQERGMPHEDSYVDACHFCYCLRRSLLDAYPEYLGPRVAYGLT
jgi:hypothetical protein